ncbi:aldehyde dehydrogenase [Nevskia soli]|uniref:aldehyde dehydrogenase n=1 Tax=Nevskia soli TaxID=418856 RepID=UPI00056974FB|nr:aldehyde dehydrogenase [Nevskia soli]
MFDPGSEITSHVRDRFYINGEWIRAHSSERSVLVSPDTELKFIDAPLADQVDVDRAVAAARNAFDSGPWPGLAPAQRAVHLRALAVELRRRLPLFSRLWTAQVGAPVSFANLFVGVAPAMFDYYADLLETYAFEDRRKTAYGHAQVIREPVGVAALIAPWNATLPILSYKLAAALAAGCTTVVKSSPETPLDLLLLAECAEAVGIPPGVVNVITADREAGAYLVAQRGIDKVSFTGSTAAGKQIARVCIDRMARFTLELGGKSAAILLDDVDLATILGGLAPFTMPFSGQICFAQTRIIAPRKRLDEIVQAYAGAMSGLVVGDPWSEATHLGPLSSARQLDRTIGYVERAVAEGARLVTGGKRSGHLDRGYYFQPTVFADVTADMTIAREEVFGPVVSVIAYDDVEDAIRLANDSDFGLSGTVFSSDPERGYQVARRIKTGNIGVNGLEMAPNIPFGGYKQSGVGREGGPEGLEAFLETKAVYRIGVA